jgi:hypothetical protein
MDSKEIKIGFDGFGAIPSSPTTFAQGIGRGGSFAPIWTDRISQRPRAIYEPNQDSSIIHPFQLTVVNNVNVSKVRIQYGEIDGVAPNGLTLDTDYLIEPGNSFIYLIVTFDGDGRINSRTIDFDNPVPADTDDEKHIVIGEVEYTGGVYKIINQNITQDIYPEKALVVDRSNSEFVYSLFADPRRINAIYELENFNVNLDGENLTTRLYLKSEDSSEFLELKKDSDAKECSVYGYSGNYAQNFVISSNDSTSKSKLELYDDDNANFFTSIVDSTSKVSVRGYSNNEEQQFLIEANSVDGFSKSVLFDSGSANYLECKVDTDNKVTKILGYSDDQNDLFSIESDGVNAVAKLKLQAGGANKQTIEIKNDDTNGYTQIKGISGGNSSFTIKVDTTDNPKITLDDGDTHLVEIDIPQNGSSTPVSASWKEIDICVEGEAKKMKVLGTEPY